MNKIAIPAMLLGLSMVFSCNTSTSEQVDATEGNKESNLDGGSFLMYYYPTHSMYTSTDGNSLGKSDTCMAYPNMIATDASGVLYTAVFGKKPMVSKSTDGGKSWTEVSSSAAEAEWNSYVITAGKANSVYMLSNTGTFLASKDGGKSWEKRTTPCAKDTIHSSPAFGMEAFLAVSADGSKLLAQAWYFEETVLSVSEDDGKTWTAITPPTERNSSRGVGFCGNSIMYASYDQVFTTSDMGNTWATSTPAKLFAPNSESNFYGYRHFVTDGDKYVMGVEVPSAESSRNDKNKYPGALFISTDGGKTFETKPFPHNTDPTPNASDEYVWLTWVKKQ